MSLSFRWWMVLLLALALMVSRADAAGEAVAPPAVQLMITSITDAGTNLDIRATIPTNMTQAFLEMRPTVAADWVEVGPIAIPADGGEFSFIAPKPQTATAFFRLKATLQPAPAVVQPQATAVAVSTELQYKVIPSLASKLTKAGDAFFYFKGAVDGSDRIVITRDGATWNHVNWGWPDQAVTINYSTWNAREKNYLTSQPAKSFLPEGFSLESVHLEMFKGRDLVSLERTNGALVVYLNDTQGGAGIYEFRILFHPIAKELPKSVGSTVAHLKIAANIDGSERIKITATEAKWEHLTWGNPTGVTLNGIPWSPAETNRMANAGTNLFLPKGVDFSTAKIVSRKGRDTATMWAEKNAVWVRFADNPNGGDDYEMELSFGQ